MIKLLTIFFLAVFFIGCNKDDSTPEIIANFGEDVKVRPKQIVKFHDGNPELKLKLVEVIDGFCPPNSQCITAGSATIKIGKEEDNYTNLIELCKGECEPTKVFTETASTTFTYSNQKYRLIFKSIHSDYNEKRFNKTVKNVTLLVEKL